MLNGTEINFKTFAQDKQIAINFIKQLFSKYLLENVQENELLLNQLATTLFSIADATVREQFAEIICQFASADEGLIEDNFKKNILRNLCQLSAVNIQCFCMKLIDFNNKMNVIIKNYDINKTALLLAMQYPNEYAIILGKIENHLQGKDSNTQMQICYMLSEYLPRAIKLIFEENLAAGFLKWVKRNILSLLFKDSKLVDLFEKRILKMDQVNGIIEGEINLYKSLIGFAVPVDKEMVKFVKSVGRESVYYIICMQHLSKKFSTFAPENYILFLLILKNFYPRRGNKDNSEHVEKAVLILDKLGVAMIKQLAGISCEGARSDFRVCNNLLEVISKYFFVATVLSDEFIQEIKNLLELVIQKKLSIDELAFKFNEIWDKSPNSGHPAIAGQPRLSPLLIEKRSRGTVLALPLSRINEDQSERTPIQLASTNVVTGVLPSPLISSGSNVSASFPAGEVTKPAEIVSKKPASVSYTGGMIPSSSNALNALHSPQAVDPLYAIEKVARLTLLQPQAPKPAPDVASLPHTQPTPTSELLTLANISAEVLARGIPNLGSRPFKLTLPQLAILKPIAASVPLPHTPPPAASSPSFAEAMARHGVNKRKPSPPQSPTSESVMINPGTREKRKPASR